MGQCFYCTCQNRPRPPDLCADCSLHREFLSELNNARVCGYLNSAPLSRQQASPAHNTIHVSIHLPDYRRLRSQSPDENCQHERNILQRRYILGPRLHQTRSQKIPARSVRIAKWADVGGRGGTCKFGQWSSASPTNWPSDLQDTSDICAGISQSTHHDTK